jgi:hypothetical protein
MRKRFPNLVFNCPFIAALLLPLLSSAPPDLEMQAHAGLVAHDFEESFLISSIIVIIKKVKLSL